MTGVYECSSCAAVDSHCLRCETRMESFRSFAFIGDDDRGFDCEGRGMSNASPGALKRGINSIINEGQYCR